MRENYAEMCKQLIEECQSLTKCMERKKKSFVNKNANDPVCLLLRILLAMVI